MSRKPRPTSEEILTPELLLRYSTAGLYIGIACVGIYASYFLDNGIALQDLRSWSTCADSSSCSIYADLAYPQTLALTTLVTIELLKALCTVSSSSIFKVSPLQNPWLLTGVAVPFGLNLAIIYTPALENSFGLVPLTVQDWFHGKLMMKMFQSKPQVVPASSSTQPPSFSLNNYYPTQC